MHKNLRTEPNKTILLRETVARDSPFFVDRSIRKISEGKRRIRATTMFVELGQSGRAHFAVFLFNGCREVTTRRRKMLPTL